MVTSAEAAAFPAGLPVGVVRWTESGVPEVELFARLDRLDVVRLFDYGLGGILPPEAVARPPAEKNGLSGVEHHRPRGWERFVERLCGIDCVARVCFDAAARSGPAVKVLDADTGTLGVRFGGADTSLPLRVETSARGEAQSELVAEYVRERMG